MTEMISQAQRSPQERTALYQLLRDAANRCEQCGLCRSRKNVVVGEGSLTSRIMFSAKVPARWKTIRDVPSSGRLGSC